MVGVSISILPIRILQLPIICIAGQSGGAIRLLKPHSLYCAVRFAKFEGILGFSVPSIILADLSGNTCFLVIGAFDPLCLFLCFKVTCL